MKVQSIWGIVAGIGTLLTIGAGSAHAGTLRWSGQVDDTAVIRLSDRNVRADGNFKGIRDVRTNVDGVLPNRPVRVRLGRENGRGDIQILEQPSARNNYTAVVKIRDWQAGGSRYAFTLDWDNGRDDRDGRGNNRRDDRRDNGWDNRWNNGRRP